MTLLSKSLSVALSHYISATPLTASNIRYKVNRIKRLRKEPRYSLLRPSPKTRRARENRSTLNSQDYSLLGLNLKEEQLMKRLTMEVSIKQKKMNYGYFALVLVFIMFVFMIF